MRPSPTTFRLLTTLLGAGFAALLSAASAHAADPSAEPIDTAEITAVKPKLRAFTDGKQHYLVLVPFDYSGPHFYYGDGTTFWQQRSYGGGRNGDEAFNRSFWEPRVRSPGESMFSLHDKKYMLDCGTRRTEFKPLPDAESAKMIASGKFMHTRWKRQSYWLARDENGRYYYVDRLREPEGNKSFRLFVGPKGSLKLQKMTNIVSDSKGDIFSTKTGELRLITSGQDGAWVQGKSKTQLTIVPIEDNHVMVYTDLGVYTGENLGTPCDDL